MSAFWGFFDKHFVNWLPDPEGEIEQPGEVQGMVLEQKGMLSANLNRSALREDPTRLHVEQAASLLDRTPEHRADFRRFDEQAGSLSHVYDAADERSRKC
jgi:hypothetical protein